MIALYPRVSTQEQALHGNSINEQIERMQSYCKAMNWNNYTIYNDAGFSGASMERPALQRLIDDVKAGKIEKVLVYKLDRLSRSQKDTLYLIEDVFLANNCNFVSMTENFDTSTPLGRAMIGILAVFAQLEREQIKERMAMGKIARAKKGLSNCGANPPIGYDYKDGNLYVNDYEAMLVKKVFDEFLRGKTPYSIAKDLNNAGLTHKYGPWKMTTIRQILKNKTYLGLVKLRDKTFNGVHSPIIDKKTFEDAQMLLEKNTFNFKQNNTHIGMSSSYLGGLIYCQKCGCKYYRKKNTKPNKEYYYYYNQNHKCKNKIWKIDELDTLIFEEIKKLSLESLHQKPGGNDKSKSQIAIINKKITEIDNQINKLMDLYTLNTIPIEVIQSKVVDLNTQKTNLENELQKQVKQEKNKISFENAIEKIQSFNDVLKRGNYEETRIVIESLIDKITLDGDNVTIYWAFE